MAIPLLLVASLVVALGVTAYVAYSRGWLGKTEESVAASTGGEPSAASAETSRAGASVASADSVGARDSAPNGTPFDLTKQATLSASSTHKDYRLSYLVDGKLDTAWVEGHKRKGDYGIGTSVTFTFPNDVWVSHVRIVPGYVKYDSKRSVDRWYSNGRVSSARLKFADGTESQVFTLDASAKTWQNMMLATPVKTKSVTFVILGIAPANTYSDHDASDTSVSEMRVFGLL